MEKEKALKILNLSSASSAEEIESAYRKLVRRYPPEMAPERFLQIQQAHEALRIGLDEWFDLLDRPKVSLAFLKSYIVAVDQPNKDKSDNFSTELHQERDEAFRKIWLSMYRSLLKSTLSG